MNEFSRGSFLVATASHAPHTTINKPCTGLIAKRHVTISQAVDHQSCVVRYFLCVPIRSLAGHFKTILYNQIHYCYCFMISGK